MMGYDPTDAEIDNLRAALRATGQAEAEARKPAPPRPATRPCAELPYHGGRWIPDDCPDAERHGPGRTWASEKRARHGFYKRLPAFLSGSEKCYAEHGANPVHSDGIPRGVVVDSRGMVSDHTTECDTRDVDTAATQRRYVSEILRPGVSHGIALQRLLSRTEARIGRPVSQTEVDRAVEATDLWPVYCPGVTCQ